MDATPQSTDCRPSDNTGEFTPSYPEVLTCAQDLNPIHEVRLIEFDHDTARLCDQMVTPSTVGTVVAVTGSGKSAYMAVLGCHALLRGKRVGLIALDMSARDFLQRMVAMLADVDFRDMKCGRIIDHTELQRVDLARAMVGQVGVLSFESERPNAWRIADVIQDMAPDFDLILCDGLDAVPQGNYAQAGYSAVMASMVRAAEQHGCAIWTTSQTVRQACGQEIVQLDDLAYSNEKANRSTITVCIGNRVPNRLWTLTIQKDRRHDHGLELIRYSIKPSWRMQVDIVPQYKDISRIPEPSAPVELEFIGRPGDMPDADSAILNQTVDRVPDENNAPRHLEQVDHDTAGDDLAEEIDADSESGDAMSVTMHYGFIALDRALFNTPMFTLRRGQDFLLVMDLYQRARFKKCTMRAPGTLLPVSLRPGEVMVSLRMLQKRWNLRSLKAVKGVLNRAMRDGMIEMYHVYEGHHRVRVSPTDTPKGQHGKILATIVSCRFIKGFAAVAERPESSDATTEGHTDGHNADT